MNDKGETMDIYRAERVDGEVVGYEFENMIIPNDPTNRHYVEMQEKVASGEAQIVEPEQPLPGDVE